MEGSSLPMDQQGGYLEQQFFESPQQNSIGKITPCPSLNNITCLKPIYRKELNREKKLYMHVSFSDSLTLKSTVEVTFSSHLLSFPFDCVI